MGDASGMNGNIIRHHWPSIDDWVCNKHNARLYLWQGRARCPRDGCMPWLSSEEIYGLRKMQDQFIVVSTGHVLRNIKRALSEKDMRLLRYIEDVDGIEDGAVRYWHLFAGIVPVGEIADALPGFDLSAGSKVYLSTVVGPVLEPADGVFARSGEPLKNGIPLGDPEDPLADEQHLALLKTWEHNPTEEELLASESVEVAKAYANGCVDLHVIRSTVRWVEAREDDDGDDM